MVVWVYLVVEVWKYGRVNVCVDYVVGKEGFCLSWFIVCIFCVVLLILYKNVFGVSFLLGWVSLFRFIMG